MGNRNTRLDVALNVQEECVQDAEKALEDGYQPHDEPVIRAALIGIRVQILEIEDVGEDIKAIRRACTVGRHAVFDDRARARDNALRKTRLEYRMQAKGRDNLQVVHGPVRNVRR